MSANGDPVSWFLIEAGWEVVDSAGEKIGTVEAVTGDGSLDIFDGLAVASSLFQQARYVPAEAVAGITEGRVALTLDRAQVNQLDAFER